MQIEDLQFSVRTYHCLKRAGIDTEAQLSRMTDDELMHLRGFGVGCLAEVRAKIAMPRKTNADSIRALNDKDLRNFMCGLMKCEGCGFGTPSGCKLEEWLQQPVED